MPSILNSMALAALVGVALLAVIVCLIGEFMGALFAGSLAKAIVDVLPI
jgi:hypothetical protein